jgi:hypothetical protein
MPDLNDPILAAGTATPRTTQSSEGKPVLPRRLLLRADLIALLQLPEPKVQWLINTHQIRALYLAGGEERFDSRDLDHLIDTYRQIAIRKGPHVE